MKINVYLKNMARKPGAISTQLLAMLDGLQRHGVPYNVLKVGQAADCDIAIVWGVRKTQEMKRAKRVLVMERGYVGDRFHWTSCGWDGLNGYANFCNEQSPSDRWDALFSEHMHPWREDQTGKYVLIFTQVPGDASLRGMDTHLWAARLCAEFEKRKIKYKIRLHPKDRTINERLLRTRRYNAAKQKYVLGSLDEALADARWCVAYNSNAAVDAVLAGVPTVTMDAGSMAYPVTGHTPFERPDMPDRLQWAHNLAFTQWSIEEIQRGDAWDHLKRGL